jgi:hypothetical protein
MATVIDKLLKDYSVKEIEEILFKSGFKAKKEIRKRYSHITKSSSESEKRILVA